MSKPSSLKPLPGCCVFAQPAKQAPPPRSSSHLLSSVNARGLPLTILPYFSLFLSRTAPCIIWVLLTALAVSPALLDVSRPINVSCFCLCLSRPEALRPAYGSPRSVLAPDSASAKTTIIRTRPCLYLPDCAGYRTTGLSHRQPSPVLTEASLAGRSGIPETHAPGFHHRAVNPSPLVRLRQAHSPADKHGRGAADEPAALDRGCCRLADAIDHGILLHLSITRVRAKE